MGIRVDETALTEQLKKAGCEDRKELPYHKMLLNGELPYTIGGGIGQSPPLHAFIRPRARRRSSGQYLARQNADRVQEETIYFFFKFYIGSGWNERISL